ncbi:hypothetical protein ACOMHN_017911 [Nucella lapillus]
MFRFVASSMYLMSWKWVGAMFVGGALLLVGGGVMIPVVDWFVRNKIEQKDSSLLSGQSCLKSHNRVRTVCLSTHDAMESTTALIARMNKAVMKRTVLDCSDAGRPRYVCTGTTYVMAGLTVHCMTMN